ncbi:hypothetical protein [Kineococcus sp. SYSU DK005]|uniref:hypothetical protein n=1 Tax=Kineococcus sp. SYSU DK005 TaxID=3383126 RepID=UPI003D7D61A2
MVSDSREHDTFGPWIEQVHTPHDVPRLYRDHPLDLNSARLVLKVPRNIPRREALAETDLYEHLLVVHPQRLSVLSRHHSTHEAPAGGPGGYRTRHVDLDDVVAVHDEVDLLDAHLHVHTRDGGVLSLSYNGSARGHVQRLIDELRRGSTGTTGAAGSTRAPCGAGADVDTVMDTVMDTVVDTGVDTGGLAMPSLGADDLRDVAVVADYLHVARRRPDLLPLAWHARQVLRPRCTSPAGAWRRLSHLRSPMTLQAALLARDGTHLEVFTRRRQLVRGQRPVHCSSRLVLALRTLERVTARPNSRYRGATDITLHAGQARLHLSVPTGSLAESVLRLSATWPSS